MKMDGEYTLPTNVENVWNNLNDPLVLKNSIPGCTQLIKENDLIVIESTVYPGVTEDIVVPIIENSLFS